jgi:hypothetical protein
MPLRRIEKGIWKGWEELNNGMYTKTLGKNGSNPCIHAEKGYFTAYDEKGKCKGTFDSYTEALESLGLKDGRRKNSKGL